MKITLDPTNPRRPDWVRDDDMILTRWYRGDPHNPYFGAVSASGRAWSDLKAFEIADNHPYAIATNLGFTYWPGGDREPEYIDRSKLVLFRNGTTSRGDRSYRWNHIGSNTDIIGYHKLPVGRVHDHRLRGMERQSRVVDHDRPLHDGPDRAADHALSRDSEDAPMTNLLTLATQIEQATEDQQISMLVAVAEHMWGCGAAPQGTDPDLWVQRWNRFNLMLAAKAYESAAMMLVPSDGSMNMLELSISWEPSDKSIWPACTVRWYPPHKSGSNWHAEITTAATPALALAAACCRTVAQMGEG